MNKTFYLPPRFALLETANDPGSAMRIEGIELTLDDFASNMLKHIGAKTNSVGQVQPSP
ncbi:MAG TPA: hypothetical protein VN608_00165 [Clostridia bacterium]|nr:hypothetical protein [Clostridia bacterium]